MASKFEIDEFVENFGPTWYLPAVSCDKNGGKFKIFEEE